MPTTTGWTVAAAVEHYTTFTLARLAATEVALRGLGPGAHPDVAVGLAALDVLAARRGGNNPLTVSTAGLG